MSSAGGTSSDNRGSEPEPPAPPTPTPPVQQIVHECTPHSVSAWGWNYLREKGLHPQDVRSAYAVLVAAAGEHKESVAQETVTRKLRDALLTGEERGKAEMERGQKIHRLL